MLCQKGRKIMLYVETRDKQIFTHIHSIGWYAWKGLSLSFPKLFAD